MMRNDNFSSFQLWGLAEGMEQAVTAEGRGWQKRDQRVQAHSALGEHEGEALVSSARGKAWEHLQGIKIPWFWDSLTILSLLHSSTHQEKS